MPIGLSEITNYWESHSVANYAALPLVSNHSNELWYVIDKQGTQWLPGSLGGTYYPRGFYFSDGINWTHQETPFQASQTAVNAGIIDDQFVSPATFINANKWLTKMDKLSSSTDNAAVKFDGTTGNIQDSNIIINDDGSITFTGVASPTYGNGKLIYDSTNRCLTFFNDDTNVALQIGQENWVPVRNVSGSSITNGKPVYITGSNSGLPTIGLAKADAENTATCIGLTTETITNNSNGYVTSLGLVRTVDTSAFAPGTIIYVDATTAGNLTSTIPSAPNYRYRVGVVTIQDATNGIILVLPGVLRLGNGTASQMMAMNSAGTTQEYVNPPYDVSGYRRTSIVTYERWYTNAVNCAPGSTVALTNNASRYTPFIVVKKCTIDRLGIDISGAGSVGSVLKLGIYNSSNSMPSTLLLDAGTVNGNSATFQAITVNQVMEPGLYFMYANHNSAANITVRTIGVSASPIVLGYPNVGGTTPATSLFVTEAYNGTLPSPAPGTMSFGTGTPICHFIRLSA